MGLPACDIVVPVFNGLTYVSDCLDSIFEHSSDYPHRLFIVDDQSDARTRCFLEAQAQLHPQIVLSRNPENLGFLRSCNLGITQGSAPYVVLVNSDVIVTPGWLARLVRCAESDSRIAAVNPLTNRAAHLDIALPPGANFYGMDWLLSHGMSPRYPDVVTGVGFCLLLRRAALERVGLFDEIYGRGYCEDSDLCMRLVAQGYRTVVADDVYVYHRGSGSFVDREQRYRHNRRIFDARWSDEYRRQFRAFRRANPLQPLRTEFMTRHRWAPVLSMKRTYGEMKQSLRQRDLPGLVMAALQGLRQLPTASRMVVTREDVDKITRPGRLRVTYVLRSLNVGGGVLSVLQLVNELILLGVEARIVALREYPEIANWKLLTRPILFATERELRKHFPPSDIAVATLWCTAPWVADVVRKGRARMGAYFLQDYESWFFPETHQRARAKVLETYKLIPHKIVKSDWLQALLTRDGFSAQKIRLGMDLKVFYPREVVKPAHPVILAMTRPQTPRRGFPFVVDALQRVKSVRPDAEIVVFGDKSASRWMPFAHRNEGVVSDQNRLAELYARADVFLDGSTFQGFGRPALEAMACGAACVLTDVGGVQEYARDGKNCLLVPPERPAAFADRILEILADEKLKKNLIAEGFETAKHYCHKREARETLAYFNHILDASATILLEGSAVGG